MVTCNPDQISYSLIDIWPEGVGYDKFCGYKSKNYDSQSDPIQKVQMLVESWKKTALEHGFSADNVRQLTCQPGDNGTKLTFLRDNSQPISITSNVQSIKADADVDEDPTDTCMSISISGTNSETGTKFDFYLSVYRRPSVRVYTRYSDK